MNTSIKYNWAVSRMHAKNAGLLAGVFIVTPVKKLSPPPQVKMSDFFFRTEFVLSTATAICQLYNVNCQIIN